MRRALGALLVIAACGCAHRNDAELDKTLQSATLAMRRGELDKAGALASQGTALTRDRPGSEWAWRFSLLDGEILLRKRELSKAIERLKMGPPDGSKFAPLEARYDFLQALVQVIQGQKDVALATLERARRVAPDALDVQLDIGVLDGQLRYQINRRDEADARLNAVVQAALAHGDQYHAALAFLNLGMGRLTRNRYDEALPWFDRILALSDLSEFTVYADALNDAGICYSRLGQFDEAARTQQRAVALHSRGTRREYEQALGQLGSTYLQWGDVRSGLPFLRQALTVATASNLPGDAAIWAGNLASAYVDLHEWDEAERFNDEAKRLKTATKANTFVYNTLNAAEIAYGRNQLGEATQLFEAALVSAKTDPSVLWSAHAGLANVAIAQKQPAVGAQHFETALQTIEKTRSDLLKTEYRLSFLTQLISFYRSYVDALIDAGKVERALEVADSSRGRVLAERQGIASIAIPTASAFRKTAAQSKAVALSYWLAPARSYLWIVTPAKTTLVKLPPAPEIEALVRDYQAAIDNVLVDPIATEGGPGDKLFDLLVRPALPLLPHGATVIVVPDGALYALNLETLPVDQAPRHYWIEDAAIQIAPALAMFEGHRSASAAPSLLLIGNPTPHDPEFPALKYADAEMTNVARHFSTSRVVALQGIRAFPAAYGAAHPDEFSIVHFTAHATMNPESPLESAVILSGKDGAFKLYARDVAAQPLHADLVTVSACRSAGERTYSGEGLVGFAWAFLRGGAKRVIAGLWDVDDRSTADLMDVLYGRMADGVPPAQALRDAKLSLLGRGGSTAQPYYWGPFELFTLSP